MWAARTLSSPDAVSWWLLVCVVQYDSPGERMVGLEMMLFARRALVMGVWIPPQTCGNDRCPLTHPTASATGNPRGIPAGAS